MVNSKPITSRAPEVIPHIPLSHFQDGVMANTLANTSVAISRTRSSWSSLWMHDRRWRLPARPRLDWPPPATRRYGSVLTAVISWFPQRKPQFFGAPAAEHLAAWLTSGQRSTRRLQASAGQVIVFVFNVGQADCRSDMNNDGDRHARVLCGFPI